MATHMRIVWAFLCLALLTGGFAPVAQADARGGSGTVTTFGVGPVYFNISGPRDVGAFAGNPDRIVYQDQYGNASNLAHSTYAIWEFRYPAGGYTYYSFYYGQEGWLLAEFDTTLERFHTVRGTRVGMTYAQARRRENRPFAHGCIDSGFWRFHIGAYGHLYSMVVGVNPGQRVHALHAFGPTPLPRCKPLPVELTFT